MKNSDIIKLDKYALDRFSLHIIPNSQGLYITNPDKLQIHVKFLDPHIFQNVGYDPISSQGGYHKLNGYYYYFFRAAYLREQTLYVNEKCRYFYPPYCLRSYLTVFNTLWKESNFDFPSFFTKLDDYLDSTDCTDAIVDLSSNIF